MADGGSYNDSTGAGNGSDYVYSKYTKTDRKKYNKVTKYAIDNIEENTNLPQVDVSNVSDFLALWKNETGEIGNKNYNSNGKKVKYKDIYSTKTAVGDVFESAPEMTFQLLESSDSTRGIVDIFKYIMYKYTGTDYGITQESNISFIFSTNTYAESDYIVNTSMSSDELVLTKEQLEEAITETYSGNTRTNLLGCVDDFIYIQNNNKVNAVFAVAVTIIESSGGTNWAAIDPLTYNWYSIKGSYHGNSIGEWRAYSNFNEATLDFGDLIANEDYYFKSSKYTVTAIAPTYCNETWGEDVVSEMRKIYSSIGIVATGGQGGVGGSEQTGFDISQVGYNAIIHVGTRNYKSFKQFSPAPWAGQSFRSAGSTIGYYGCSLTSIAIIASGFGHNVTPTTIENRVWNDYGYNEKQFAYTERYLSEYTGMNATVVRL